MDTTKSYFIERVNRYGVLCVRERNSEEDSTGWGALEFVLNNGEIFVICGYQFGQSPGEEGLWVDMHGLNEEGLNELKKKISPKEKIDKIDQQKSVEDYFSHHINEDTLEDFIK